MSTDKKENSKIVLEESRVLLISNSQDDYDALKAIGFKNVDSYRSKNSAFFHFILHQRELKSYDLFIYGNGCRQFDPEQPKDLLDKNVCKLKEIKQIMLVDLVNLYKTNISYIWLGWNRDEFNEPWSYIKTPKKDYDSLFRRVLEVASEYALIEDFALPANSPATTVDSVCELLPNHKEDLKILYFTPYDNEALQVVAEKLGLTVSFVDETGVPFNAEVLGSLGKYDIILGSKSYLPIVASQEQLSTIGRPLRLFAAYDFSEVPDFSLGRYWLNEHLPFSEFQNINFSYSYNSLMTKEKEDFFSRKESTLCAIPKGNKSSTNSIRQKQAEVILSIAIELYEEYRLRLGLDGLSISSLKRKKDFFEEFETMFIKRQEIEFERCKMRTYLNSLFFDILKIEKLAKKYDKMPYSKRLSDLKVWINKESIRITVLNDRRPLCAITISKGYRDSGLCVFTLESITRRGILGNPREFMMSEDIDTPNQIIPNERDARLIKGITKKMTSFADSLEAESTKKQHIPVLKKTKVPKKH